jgi:peptidoglycan/LPS O-acetylase OafA/YrhL
MNFRYDINGLRAIAVIAVVLFHFNPVWVPGGFAGVDVFFVISGFLMTGIIFRGLENDSFNLFKFYVARANRIIPALAVLCLVLLVFGWFYLTPLDYKALGKHVASSMGFLSNVIYWRESGYFDAASHEKWLLHTWSLSVEWQFYIIYPIVLVVLKRFLSLENLKRLIVIGTVLGFVFSVIATIKWPNPAYYLLPTRAWEMMMGGVAFLYPWNVSDAKKKVLEISGLLLILGSYAFVSSDIPWPGHFALIPVLGSYLMIVANRQSSVITNNKFFQSLGKWSYSIYLWHWPIVVFYYRFVDSSSYILGVTLSIFLGVCSFKFVEKYRLKSYSLWKDFFKIKLIWVTFSIGVFSSVIWYVNGLPSRWHDDRLVGLNDNNTFMLSEQLCHNSSFDESCRTDGYGSPIILLGDSHAGSIARYIYASATEAGRPFEQYTLNGCLGIDTVVRYNLKNGEKIEDSHCTEASKKISEYLDDKKKPRSTIVFVSRLPLYLSSFRFDNELGGVESGNRGWIESKGNSKASDAVVDKLNFWVSEGHELILVYPIPEVGWSVPHKYSKEIFSIFKPLGKNPSEISIEHDYKVYSNRTKDAFALLDLVIGDVHRVYPSDVFCGGDTCFANDKDHLYYYDDDHLSTHGAKLLVEKIKPYL